MTSILQDRGLVRSMLAVLLVGILIITTLWILRPFFPAIIWATMVVVATWVGFSSIQTQELAERIAPCLRVIILWFVKQIGYCSSGPLWKGSGQLSETGSDPEECESFSGDGFCRCYRRSYCFWNHWNLHWAWCARSLNPTP
jgi:hypothetical protein